MINWAKILFCLVFGGCFCVVGCHKEKRVDASRALQQSFQSSEPEVKQAIATATTSMNAGD